MAREVTSKEHYLISVRVPLKAGDHMARAEQVLSMKPIVDAVNAASKSHPGSVVEHGPRTERAKPNPNAVPRRRNPPPAAVAEQQQDNAA